MWKLPWWNPDPIGKLRMEQGTSPGVDHPGVVGWRLSRPRVVCPRVGHPSVVWPWVCGQPWVGQRRVGQTLVVWPQVVLRRVGHPRVAGQPRVYPPQWVVGWYRYVPEAIRSVSRWVVDYKCSASCVGSADGTVGSWQWKHCPWPYDLPDHRAPELLPQLTDTTATAYRHFGRYAHDAFALWWRGCAIIPLLVIICFYLMIRHKKSRFHGVN